MQFTYSRPDNDDITGICRNDGAWKYDTESEAYWDKRPQENCAVQSGEEAECETVLVADAQPFLLARGRRRVKRESGVGSGDIEIEN